jgi:hypothetical protein
MAVPGTNGARKKGPQYAMGIAAATVTAASWSGERRQSNQSATDERIVVIPKETAPWKRAWGDHWGLKRCESFQSARKGATTVMMAAREMSIFPMVRVIAFFLLWDVCMSRS